MKTVSLPPEKGSLVLCDGATALGRRAAECFVQAAEAAVQDAGTFSVALSGGSTPELMYQQLAGPEFRERVPWAQGEYFWSDERCVPPQHPQSNYGLAQRALLSQVPIPRHRIHRMPGELDPERAAGEYEQELRGIFRVAPPDLPRFDLVLLGMGDDGHTASLFPGSAALDESTRWVAANYVKKFNAHRLTLTFPVINAARNVVFLVSGGGKAPALRQVMRGGGAPVPAERVHPQDGKLIWFVDEAAAAQLD
ncbi:MAG TPA: 6-phosphogluconolactonase [Terriglobales bacterium]|jgi:6-phosphogluconolactonase|nr:6-phosphogluconolactonase [Terriglobales bacterium]